MSLFREDGPLKKVAGDLSIGVVMNSTSKFVKVNPTDQDKSQEVPQRYGANRRTPVTTPVKQ